MNCQLRYRGCARYVGTATEAAFELPRPGKKSWSCAFCYRKEFGKPPLSSERVDFVGVPGKTFASTLMVIRKLRDRCYDHSSPPDRQSEAWQGMDRLAKDLEECGKE